MESQDNSQKQEIHMGTDVSGSNSSCSSELSSKESNKTAQDNLQCNKSIDSDAQGPCSTSELGVTRVEEYQNCEVLTSTSQKASTEEDKLDESSFNSGAQTTDVSNSEEVDNKSDTSDFSDLSEESWHPVQGPIAWVQEQMRQGHSPRKILEDLVPADTMIPDGLDPIMLWKIIINIVSEPPKRKKLGNVNTIDDVIHLLKTSKKIMVLTGAGVSVSCGIPDFRSRDGVYARLSVDFPNLPDPQAMFDIHFFHNDPRPFFKFAREIYPGQFRPSLCHHFIQLLESKGKLLRNYTQNIDTLEQVAGIERVVQCHGSFATATCTVCGLKVNSEKIKEDIFEQVIPLCSRCPPENGNAVMKPDIVFFGESLPEDFHNQMADDKDECDLLIVIGSSLKVRPVALIPNSLPPHVPQILINRERLHYLNFDVELLGNCDDIVGDLCTRLGESWEQLASSGSPLKEVDLSTLPTPPASPKQENTLTSLHRKKPHESKIPSENNNTHLSESVCGVQGKISHHIHKSINLVQHETKLESSFHDQISSSHKTTESSSAETNCSCNVETLQADSSTNSCKTGSINCGITPHHNQDVMFYSSKGAPHSLTEKHFAKSSSDVSHSPSSSSGQDQHHHHHHSCHHHVEKRKSDSCDEEIEPSKKHQKLQEDTEGPSDPSVSTENVENKPPKSPEQDDSMDEIRKMWKSKQRRISLAQRLSDDQVLFLPPSRYVFKGAEVFSDYDGDDSDESSSVDSCDEEDEEENENSEQPAVMETAAEEEEEREEGEDTIESHENVDHSHSENTGFASDSETQPTTTVSKSLPEQNDSS